MGLRHTLRIYKGCSKETLFRYMTQAVDVIGGKITWNVPGTSARDLRLGSQLQTHSLYLPYQWTDSVFCMKVGELSRLHWIELRIQEGSIWDYALFRGTTVIDKFSVCPQYWEGADAPEEYLRDWQGHPEVLAAAWEIPEERIARYLVNWGYVDDPNDENIFHFSRQG